MVESVSEGRARRRSPYPYVPHDSSAEEASAEEASGEGQEARGKSRDGQAGCGVSTRASHFRVSYSTDDRSCARGGQTVSKGSRWRRQLLCDVTRVPRVPQA